MYAIVRIAGKQVIARPQETVEVPRLRVEAGSIIRCDEVIAFSDGSEVRVGTPLLQGVTVTGEVLGHTRGEKIRIYKMKRRKGYRRTLGHVQEYTKIRIKEITA